MNSPPAKRSVLWGLLTAILILYWFAPIIAGLFPNVDSRGPKIFWSEHHQLLCTLSHEFVYDVKPRPFLNKRAWFYGLEGKPDPRIETKKAMRSFEDQVEEGVLLAFRHSVWRDGNGRFPLIIARSEWPQSFATNGVLEVRTEKYSIYVVLKQGPDYEAGILLLGTESAKAAVENDPAYSRGMLWKNGVYRYYRESESR